MNNNKENETIELTGQDLTFEQIYDISHEGAKVCITEGAMQRLALSHKLLLQGAVEGKEIYGVTRGVGLNKDKVLFEGDALTPETLAASEKFNKNVLRSHSCGVGEGVDEEIVRALMTIRLNTSLRGFSALHPSIALGYKDFLNHGIHPVVPERGTVGEADITNNGHIGLVMMGEHFADYNGERISGEDALKRANLSPLKPYAKDALSIVNTNAFGASQAVLMALDVKKFLDTADIIFALSLEGFNGNVAPFMSEPASLRPFKGFEKQAERLRKLTKNSYLWEVYEGRALQDPLSFRDYFPNMAATRNCLESLLETLMVQINHADDNPAVIPGVKLDESEPSQKRKYQVYKDESLYGMIVPTSGLRAIAWVLPMEQLAIALSHISKSSCLRTTKLSTVFFTGLSRFLTPKDDSLGYTTIQKPFASLDAEIRHLSNPSSADLLPLAGDIEDIGTNSTYVIKKLRAILDNLYHILGIELLHAAQAVDLRMRDESSGVYLGDITKKFHGEFRKEVPFLSEDRVQTYDIKKSHDFLINYQPE